MIKRDDFDFEIVNFPFLDGDVPRSTSLGVYISQLIRFARASSIVADFNVTGWVVQIWTTQDDTNDDGIFRLSTWLF